MSLKPGGDLEQYYTNGATVKHAVEILCCHLSDLSRMVYVDFSAGDGRFAAGLGIPHVSFDLAPAHSQVVAKDWFSVTAADLRQTAGDDNILMGFNPPYGFKMKNAKAFIKHGMSLSPRYFVLLVPPTAVPREMERSYGVVSITDVAQPAFETKDGKAFSYPVRLHIFQRRAIPLDLIPMRTPPDARFSVSSGPSIDGAQLVFRISGRRSGVDCWLLTDGDWHLYDARARQWKPSTEDAARFRSNVFAKVRMQTSLSREQVVEIADLLYANPDPLLKYRQPFYTTLRHLNTTIKAYLDSVEVVL